MTLTIAAVAEHKGVTLEKIEVRIQRQTAQDALWQTAFVVQIDLGGGLTRRAGWRADAPRASDPL
jgi:hypothetical protein